MPLVFLHITTNAQTGTVNNQNPNSYYSRKILVAVPSLSLLFIFHTFFHSPHIPLLTSSISEHTPATYHTGLAANASSPYTTPNHTLLYGPSKATGDGLSHAGLLCRRIGPASLGRVPDRVSGSLG